MIETDFLAEDKIADKIKERKAAVQQNEGKDRIGDEIEPKKTRNIDILSIAAGLVTSKEFYHENTVKTEENSKSVARTKPSILNQHGQP